MIDFKKKKEDAFDNDYPLDHVLTTARKGLLPISAVLIGFTFSFWFLAYNFVYVPAGVPLLSGKRRLRIPPRD